jgi:hypothetical protein
VRRTHLHCGQLYIRGVTANRSFPPARGHLPVDGVGPESHGHE